MKPAHAASPTSAGEDHEGIISDFISIDQWTSDHVIILLASTVSAADG